MLLRHGICAGWLCEGCVLCDWIGVGCVFGDMSLRECVW